MILCVDSGNTRIKWGLCAAPGTPWLARGALRHDEIGGLPALLAAHPAPERVMVANVAGDAVGQAIIDGLAAWRDRLAFAASAAEFGGVKSGYDDPTRLGVDRWCALLGARARTRQACLVVGAGTATTIDSLDAAGNFLGGLILPGFDLMRASLARDTANLPLAQGRYIDFPRNTGDAIHSGCLEAQLGAIERAHARLARISPDGRAECLLFGGAAGVLAIGLAIPWRLADTLVLDGLACLAPVPT